MYSNYGYHQVNSEIDTQVSCKERAERHNSGNDIIEVYMQMQQHHFAPATSLCPTRLEFCRQKSGLRVVYWKAESSTFQAHTMCKCTNLLNDHDLSLFPLSTCDHINGRFLFGLQVNYCVPKFCHLLHNK